ncbi:hypothetical protein C7B62_08660 [Pleurocapsa sp. CCALA 161]|uniref:hypothetical protein n=1 Tax=Pleurocapsa sp. CCALA 161 TaxID=2107688 RepID=UPI000D076F8A|nr:hypothetical protein [Pleurocapsa sp. CCALA 161]PSB10639.1 hypothetical protein C7B62_08660 [Pleurocapsa sp. CCALA 161]
MSYNNKNRQNNRIQDLHQIAYVKSILETAVNHCQQSQMSAPEIYQATAQRIADLNSLNDPTKPRITFNTKQQALRGQDSPITELTATIGDKTSTSYFLLKDSLPVGTQPSQEQLTYLRPDVVSARIAASLGIAQLPQTVPTVTIPTPNNNVVINPPPTTTPAMSKAGAFVQGINATQPQANVLHSFMPIRETVAERLAALATGTVSQVPSPVPAAPTSSPNNQQQVNVNPYQNTVVSAPIPTPETYSESTNSLPLQPQAPQPIHNPQQAQIIQGTTENIKLTGKLSNSVGQTLKQMSKGQINPIQLYGNTLQIIGQFLMGSAAGINEARLEKIMKQIEKIEQEKEAVDKLRKQTGQKLMDLRPNPVVESDINLTQNQTTVWPPQPQSSQSPSTKTSAAPVPTARTYQAGVLKDTPSDKATSPVLSSKIESTVEARPTNSQVESEPTAIERLLKSKAPIEEKLGAIEKTLDKMLEELTNTRKALESLQTSIQSPQQQNHDKVLETEAKTDIAAVNNISGAEVPVRTEIDTEIVTEAKSHFEAAKEVEVPEVEVDSTRTSRADEVSSSDVSSPDENLDIGSELADTISSYEGDLTRLNHYLKSANLQIDIAESGSSLKIEELENGIPNILLTAEANGKEWDINSQISDSVKLDVMNSFIEAEELALAETNEPQPQQQSSAPVKEELSMDMA